VHEGWLARFYLQVGDPYAVSRYPVGLAVIVLGALGELGWRGGVMPALASTQGPRRAWLVTAGLEALSWAPTVWLLRDPAAGLNPVGVAAVLVSGLVFGAVATHSGRLLPVMIGHALVGWGLVEYRLWQF
jgi:membrane protease YdiL (CAAX protease family)